MHKRSNYQGFPNHVISCFKGIVSGPGSNAPGPENIMIIGNTIDENGTSGTKNEGISATGRTSGAGSVDDWTENIVIADNVINGMSDEDNTLSGAMVIHSVKNIAIHNNIMKDPGHCGIMLSQDVNGATVSGNVVSGVWSDSVTNPAGISCRQGGTWTAWIHGNNFRNSRAIFYFIC